MEELFRLILGQVLSDGNHAFLLSNRGQWFDFLFQFERLLRRLGDHRGVDDGFAGISCARLGSGVDEFLLELDRRQTRALHVPQIVIETHFG